MNLLIDYSNSLAADYHAFIINSKLKGIFSCLIKKQEKMRISVKLISIF